MESKLEKRKKTDTKVKKSDRLGFWAHMRHFIVHFHKEMSNNEQLSSQGHPK